MKRLLRALLLALCAAAPAIVSATAASTTPAAPVSPAAPAAAATTFGTHGMALFGDKDGLYASHLPMFHAPHDYQVVLQIRLSDPAQDRALRERLHGKTALWTISPEKFEIDRLAPASTNPLKQFKADMVLGHFEQDGKPQLVGVTAIVDKVLVYRQLSPALRQAETQRYLRIGRDFLLKEVDSRPDFDHIVLVKGVVGKTVSLKHTGVSQPANQALAVASGAKVIGTIYYYTDDLK
jgi:hypothetical protein